MIDVYFIRHGETGGNIAKRHQQENSELTQLGRQQAQAAAQKVTTLHPTHLYVSTRVRAIETGQAIAKVTDLIPETNDLFVEICRPQSMYGHRHRSVKTVRYLWQWWRGKVGGEDCGVDGESYQSFLRRLQQAKAFLESHDPNSRIVVVSHSVFITLFLSHMNNPKPLSIGQAIRVYVKIKSLPNGEIVHVQLAKKQDPGWHLRTAMAR